MMTDTNWNIVPAGNERIIICHFNEGGTWEALDVPHQALEGHSQHETDVWPPVPEVTEGMNWPLGQEMYLNNCVLTASATPSPSPSPTGTLPPTGASETITALLGGALILVGVWLKVKSLGH
jgi:hypothetical protein